MRITGRSARLRVGALLSRLAGMLMLSLVALTMVSPLFTAIPYARGTAIASFAVLLMAVVYLVRRGPVLPERLARVLALPVGIACTVVAGFVGYASSYVTTWDSKLMQNIVSRPVDTITAYQVSYLSRYPNNDVLLALARQARRMGDTLGWDYGTAFLAIQVLLFALALLGVHLLTTLVSSRAAALMAMVFVTVFVGLSPWLAVPYTDLPSMWTPVWAVYCFARARRSDSRLVAAVWVATGGAVLALGYSLKVTPVVVVAAAAVWFVAAAVLDRSRRSLATGGVALVALTAGLLVGLVGTSLVVARVADAPATTPGVAASPWHYVAGGLRVQTGPNGNGRSEAMTAR